MPKPLWAPLFASPQPRRHPRVLFGEDIEQEIAMGSGRAGKGMGNQATTGHQTVGTTDPRLPDESEMSQQAQGNNQLAGSDQARSHNERRRASDETTQTEGVIESFKRRDPKTRAAATNKKRR
jgi:hypothetical protein